MESAVGLTVPENWLPLMVISIVPFEISPLTLELLVSMCRPLVEMYAKVKVPVNREPPSDAHWIRLSSPPLELSLTQDLESTRVLALYFCWLQCG